MKPRLILLLIILNFLPLSPLHAQSARITPAVNVIKKWASCVVNISTEQVVLLGQTPFLLPNADLLNGIPENLRISIGQTKLNSIGSGVIVSPDGLIVTNAHVILMAKKLYVTLSDGATVPAQLIGTSNQDDLALLQITPPHELTAAHLANDVLIGENVITIGNPLGLQNSVSVGVVSGVKRNFTVSPTQVFADLIQIDASLNLGSSGGALLNLDGDLTGINLAVVQNAQNISFAISADKVKRLLADYENYKKNTPRSPSP